MAAKVRYWEGSEPVRCQLCGRPFGESAEPDKEVFVDGKTVYGPWALMCNDCHTTRGCGLGTGKGQMYNWRTRRKVEPSTQDMTQRGGMFRYSLDRRRKQ